MDALVRERYPGLLSRSRLESGDWVDYAVDASRAERELGMGFRGMEGQVGMWLNSSWSWGIASSLPLSV